MKEKRDNLLTSLSRLKKQILRSVRNESYSHVNDTVQRFNVFICDTSGLIDRNPVTQIKPLANDVRNMKQHREKLDKLSDAIDVLEHHLVKEKKPQQLHRDIVRFQKPIAIIETIGDRFHQIADELCREANRRPTFPIKNEYAAQGLFHALLKLFFDDIRAEESVPIQMGASGRIDFFIPGKGIGIEIKMIRPGFTDKKLGDEISIDIVRYQALKGCNKLYCFIYDPKQKIKNPRGFEADAAKKSTEQMTITAVIRP